MLKNKILNVIWILFTVILLACFNIQANDIYTNDNSDKPEATNDSLLINRRHFVPSGWTLVDHDTTKWHPKEFIIINLDMKVTFKLPFEADKSGVRNLFFQSKKSGKILMLDEEKVGRSEPRSYTKFDNGKYNAFLLYNNGKYIKYNNIEFSDSSSINVDLTKFIPH